MYYNNGSKNAETEIHGDNQRYNTKEVPMPSLPS